MPVQPLFTKDGRKRRADIDVDELKASLQQAVKRASYSRRYDRIVVLMISWDYDGPKNNFMAGSHELEDLFRNTYKYEVRRTTLLSRKDENESSFFRDLNAFVQLLNACLAVADEFKLDTDLIIVSYRGHGSNHKWYDPRMDQPEKRDDEMIIMSGEYDDDYGSDVDEDGDEITAKRVTQISFTESAKAFSSSAFSKKSQVVFLMDCCVAYNAVHHLNQPLLAASGPRAAANKSGDTDFNSSLITLLKQAHATNTWLTFGMLHTALLDLVERKKLEITPVWYRPKEFRRGVVRGASPMFYPLGGALGTITNTRDPDKRWEENQANLARPHERVMVALRINMPLSIPQFTAAVAKELTDALRATGVVNPVADSAGCSIWITAYVDGTVWHELDDHEGILFAGFVKDLPKYGATAGC